VARFASRRRAVGTLLLHPLLELALMRVGMAAGAVQILPVVDCGWLGLELGRFFVAVAAGNRDVPAGEDEPRLFMLRQTESGGFVSLEGVAAIAGVEIRRGGKLAGVTVQVAVRAVGELDLELGVFAFRDVALGALQTRMAALQRIGAGGVFLDCERRRLPAPERVAGGAFSAIDALGELPFVWVGHVTIHALRERQRLLEISVDVTLGAVDRGVSAF